MHTNNNRILCSRTNRTNSLISGSLYCMVTRRWFSSRTLSTSASASAASTGKMFYIVKTLVSFYLILLTFDLNQPLQLFLVLIFCFIAPMRSSYKCALLKGDHSHIARLQRCRADWSRLNAHCPSTSLWKGRKTRFSTEQRSRSRWNKKKSGRRTPKEKVHHIFWCRISFRCMEIITATTNNLYF